MADPPTVGPGTYAARNGWDRDYPIFPPGELPTYVGLPTFCKRALVTDAAELARRAPDAAIVGAPFDDGVSFRAGARF